MTKLCMKICGPERFPILLVSLVVKKTCPMSMRFIGPKVINQQRSITKFPVNVLQFFLWILLNKIHFYNDLSNLTRLIGPPVICNLRIASEFPLLNIIEILIAVSLLICNYHGAWMLHLEMCVTVLHLYGVHE